MGQVNAKNIKFEKLKEIDRPVLGFNPPQIHKHGRSKMPVLSWTP